MSAMFSIPSDVTGQAGIGSSDGSSSRDKAGGLDIASVSFLRLQMATRFALPHDSPHPQKKGLGAGGRYRRGREADAPSCPGRICGGFGLRTSRHLELFSRWSSEGAL